MVSREVGIEKIMSIYTVFYSLVFTGEWSNSYQFLCMVKGSGLFLNPKCNVCYNFQSRVIFQYIVTAVCLSMHIKSIGRSALFCKLPRRLNFSFLLLKKLRNYVRQLLLN